MFTPATTEGSHVVYVIHAPSMGAAKAARRGFVEALGIKLDAVTIEEAPVKTGKAGTIAYLNAFHAQVPASYKPAGYPKPTTAVKKKAAKKK